MERKKLEGPAGTLPAGHTVLMLAGPRGAVTLEAWEDRQFKPIGVLSVHRTEAMYESQAAGPCEFLPEGCCYADQSFTVGYAEAPFILAGYDSAAWVTLLHFYRERIDPEGEDRD
jgi:hypothetical protein